jgi:hypothetical protein
MIIHDYKKKSQDSDRIQQKMYVTLKFFFLVEL